MISLPRVRIIITGIVQGVGFRPFLFNLAREFELTGRILNSGNLGVVCDFQGPTEEYDFKDFIQSIRDRAPPIAMIEEISQLSAQLDNKIDYSHLTIEKSAEDIGPSITLPPDIAVCDDCIKDMQNSQLNRYFDYPFIACAQCGPRFTTMRSLPYDRQNSTMDAFPLCSGKDSCQTEYFNFNDRRFHAETFACHRCGPYYFTVHSNEVMPEYPVASSIDEVGEAVLEGKIAAIKGIGGIFLICLATDFDIIARLRERKRDRKNKPFAVMFPNLQVASKFVEISENSEQLLTSFRRPILLLPKTNNKLPENIAPGLIHLGSILPYTGVHYLLFNALKNQPIIYTSGNLSSLPMAIKNEEIFNELHEIADIFYLHNREIYQRADDSVIRPVLGVPSLIRRSRGFVPEYYKLPFTPKYLGMIAVGPELNSTGAIAREDRIFPTQHIGNVRNLETYQFLSDALQHMQSLLKLSDIEIDGIAHDLHPAFQSTRLAKDFAEKISQKKNLEVPLFPIQHHFAHLASLMVDHKLSIEKEIVLIAIDGVGYGLDNQPWGGEILVGGYNNFERMSWLQPIPMLGGDLATQFPGRLTIGALSTNVSNDESQNWIESWNDHVHLEQSLPQGQQELDFIIRSFLGKNQKIVQNSPQTSSLGRWLDAVASLLNVCQVKTYQGEPAIRLEGYAWEGQAESHFDIQSYIKGEIIQSIQLFQDYANLLVSDENFWNNEKLCRNLARSMISDISTCLALKAINIAQQKGISQIGVSGGVAVNEIIMETIKSLILSQGFEFLQHERVPCGDAGISTGQIAIMAAKSLQSD